MIELTDDEAKELQALVMDIQRNPFASGEIQALGGVRAVLSDEVLRKLGFEVEGPRPVLAVRP